MKDLTAGACVKTVSSCVKPVPPCAKSEYTVGKSVTTNPVVSKEQLLSRMMKANEDLMKSMMDMMSQNQILTGQMLAQLEKM